MNIAKYKNSVLLLALFASCSFQAGAVPVQIEGTDLVFSYDNSVYGDAFVAGNGLFFLPDDYLAVSGNTTGQATNELPFALRVAVKPDVDRIISKIHFIEAGDYELDITSNTSPEQEVSALLNLGSLSILDTLTAWSIYDAIDLTGWAGASDITIDITDTLEADADALGDLALVQKKFLFFRFELSPVVDTNAALAIRIPEPGMLALMLAGLAGIFAVGRRKP